MAVDGVNMPMPEFVALLVATSFAAGLNTYATVGTLGILGRYHVLVLPDGLHLLMDWWVIAVAAALFVVEFFADKIPAFDLIWNAMHTFVRIPVAALMAYKGTASLTPQEQMLATIVGGLIALAAHGGKTAARVAVTPSPEPFSNGALSLIEDAMAIGLTWFATKHPFAAAGIVVVGLVFVVLILRFVLRSMTDEIMYGLMALSGQEYVDIYAQRAKADIVAARAAAADAARAAAESAGGSVDAPAAADRATETPQVKPARWSRLARRARRARIRRPGRGRTPL